MTHNIEIPTREELENEAFLNYARAFYVSKNVQEGDHAAAQWLLKYRNIITEPLTERMYVYDPQKGYYTKAGESLLKNDLANVFGTTATRTRVGEILSKAGALSYRDPDELELTTPANLIPLENGVYNLNTNQLLKHSPEWFFTYKHPVRFNQAAGCPNITNFLNTIVEKPYEEILTDIIALSLFRGKLTRHFFILHGEGHNGKSKYIDLIRNILGKQRCSSITPHNIEKNQFASSQLHDKHANLGADIPGGVINDLTIIKSITGGDPISVEFKGKDRFETYAYTEIVCSSNTPPRFTEDTRAVWDRLITINFPFLFVPEEEVKLPHHRVADLELEEKLGDSGELSGFLNVVIARLTQLRKTKRLTVKITPEETKAEYALITNTPLVFIQECCVQNNYVPGDREVEARGWVSRNQLYREYQNWCVSRKVKIESSSLFGRRIKEIPGWSIEEGKESGGVGDRIYSFRNISFITKEPGSAVSPVSENAYSDPKYKSHIESRIGSFGDSVDRKDRKIESVQEIVSFISQLQDKIVITTEIIAKYWGGQPEHLHIALEVLLARGDIFSPNQGFWRVP